MKRLRQHAILEIIRAEPVGSQTAILEKLHGLGIRATQPTISRDLEELGLARIRDGDGHLRYALPSDAAPRHGGRLRHLLDEFAMSMEASGNLVVLRTPPGAANALADALDDATLEDVAGTVAGDDTILVIARDGVAGRDVVERLQALMGGAT